MEEAPGLVERREGYRVVTLNRPRHLTAFTEAMHAPLKRALAEPEDDGDCRALLLTGAGRAFCTGQDLHERLDKDGKAIVLGRALDTYYNPLVRSCAPCRFRSLPRSTASPPAPAPTSRSPAISFWRRARQASSRPSPRSGSFP